MYLPFGMVFVFYELIVECHSVVFGVWLDISLGNCTLFQHQFCHFCMWFVSYHPYALHGFKYHIADIGTIVVRWSLTSVGLRILFDYNNILLYANICCVAWGTPIIFFTYYCISGNFHQEKIFVNFAICSHWRNFYYAVFLSCVNDYIEDMATFITLAKILFHRIYL